MYRLSGMRAMSGDKIIDGSLHGVVRSFLQEWEWEFEIVAVARSSLLLARDNHIMRVLVLAVSP